VFKVAIVTTIFLAGTAFAQQEPPPQQPSGQPQVRLNYLNVCTPSAEEQAVIKDALAAVPGKPSFIQDFEVSRGIATLKDAPASRFVRVRREYSAESPLLTAQYSMSTDENSTVELLVLRRRDPKEFHEVVIEDRVSAGAAAPLAIVATDTPVTRIRVERLSKSSVGLSRCEGANQGAYEALFRQASDIMAQYRQALGLRGAFRSDIAWLSSDTAVKHSTPAPQKTPK
jgi:hypothetical protein